MSVTQRSIRGVLGCAVLILCTALASGGCAARRPPDPGVMQTIRGDDIAVLQGPAASMRVFFFIDPVCPIANAYVPEILRIIKSRSGPDLDAVLVYPDRTLSDDEVRAHAAAYSLPDPLIHDRGHELVRALSATVTPEAVLVQFRGEGEGFDVRYRGRIDDIYRDFGARRAAPTRRDLMEAIDAVRDGRPVAVPAAAAIGCFIHAGG